MRKYKNRKDVGHIAFGTAEHLREVGEMPRSAEMVSRDPALDASRPMVPTGTVRQFTFNR
jgi:hypothetical protein